MIALSALVYDPAGHVVLDELPTSELDEMRRRVNRAPTLDGDVDITDRGFTHGDRDMRFRWRIKNEGQYLLVQRLFKMYPLLMLSVREGVFHVAPVNLRRADREGDLEVMVRRKIG